MSRTMKQARIAASGKAAKPRITDLHRIEQFVCTILAEQRKARELPHNADNPVNCDVVKVNLMRQAVGRPPLCDLKNTSYKRIPHLINDILAGSDICKEFGMWTFIDHDYPYYAFVRLPEPSASVMCVHIMKDGTYVAGSQASIYDPDMLEGESETSPVYASDVEKDSRISNLRWRVSVGEEYSEKVDKAKKEIALKLGIAETEVRQGLMTYRRNGVEMMLALFTSTGPLFVDKDGDPVQFSYGALTHTFDFALTYDPAEYEEEEDDTDEDEDYIDGEFATEIAAILAKSSHVEEGVPYSLSDLYALEQNDRSDWQPWASLVSYERNLLRTAFNAEVDNKRTSWEWNRSGTNNSGATTFTFTAK